MLVAAIAAGIAVTLVVKHYSSSSPDAEETPLAELERVLGTEARLARDPWTLAHTLLAFGPGFQVDGGRTVSEALIQDHLREIPGVGPGFELLGDERNPGEVHPHLVLKALVGSGAEAELCGRLARSAAASFRAPWGYQAWNDVAWLLESLARLEEFDGSSALGGNLRLGEVAVGTLEQVELADRVVEQALAGGGADGFQRPSADGPPEQSGIWAYTCGGQHLLQSVLVSLERGTLPESERARVQARVDTFLTRLDAEARFRDRERQRAIDRGVARRSAYCQHAVAVLKLYGHGLETLARARDAGLEPAATLADAARQTRSRLARVLEELRAEATLENLLPELRKRDMSVWRLWFGDGCHALHGVSLWE